MRAVPAEVLRKLQKRPAHIRNVCILAHVDHGKTTLADTLVASNGIISQKMAGKLRYMDSLEEEQVRGITMKSSAISLHFSDEGEHFLVNLIDSPGHIDFSSEVSTAVRLCDGAIIVVDAVEGVSPQTHAVLRQAWLEQIKPVLMINKLDRLICEMKLTPMECYTYLQQIVEQVNAIMAQLRTGDILKNFAQENEDKSPCKTPTNSEVFNWDSGQHADENDDAHLHFSPDLGNVVFGSALDRWGFSVRDFARLYSEKLKLNEKVLLKTLWGDFYFNSKTKKVMRGALAAGKKPLFVQMVLDNIWAVYNAVCESRDASQIEKVIKALDIKVLPRELKHNDNKIVLCTIMSQWLPLSSAVLSMTMKHTPSPLEMSDDRVISLICDHSQRFESLHERTKQLKTAFQECKTGENDPVIVYVSKMCPVDQDLFPENQQIILTKADLEQRREIARLQHQQKMAERAAAGETVKTAPQGQAEEECDDESTKPKLMDKPKFRFLAFARIFSGVIRKGQKLFVLGPKHNPREAIEQRFLENQQDHTLTLSQLTGDFHITEVEVNELFTFMGRDLEPMDEIHAGNVLGIGGLEEHILKSATISSDIACPAFAAMQFEAQPIVRVAIEPRHAGDMAKLVRGMRLLNQADPCVQVLVQETGEHVLVAAGEVHLQRCCDDLRKRYAEVAIEVSAPIVPFKETIVEPPTIDMVNEAIEGENVVVKPISTSQDVKVIKMTRGKATVTIEALPLPETVIKLIDTHSKLLQALVHHISLSLGGKSSENTEATLSEQSKGQLNNLQTLVTLALKNSSNPEWRTLADRIWAFGPRRYGPNILINGILNYDRPSIWNMIGSSSSASLWEHDSAIVNGFQLATLAGPMCAEPMMGVAFVVRDWSLAQPTEAVATAAIIEEKEDEKSDNESEAGSECSSLMSGSKKSSQTTGPLSGQLISCMKEACQKAFQAQPQRLMCAMYSCNIQTTASVLGKMYGVIGKRSGRVLSDAMQEGTQVFNISAVLPVAESFGFSDEIRKKTSGLASPQLQFSHWEVIDVDPYWEPSTEEEIAHYGDKYDSENRAKNYMMQVRKRKGLKTDENLVIFAEKQRTLTKNK